MPSEEANATSTTGSTTAEASTSAEPTTGSTAAEATSGAAGTTGEQSETTTSGFDSGSTGAEGSSTEAESSETTEDVRSHSCADTASLVHAWGGRAATLGELDGPILIPGWFPSSSVVVALAPFALACDEIGEYPCGQPGDPTPHETTLIFLPEGQEAGTYEVEGPGSSVPSVLEASTSGSPPFCSTGGSGYGWEPGVLELTSNDAGSVAGVFCRTLDDGTTAAWTFDVNRC